MILSAVRFAALLFLASTLAYGANTIQMEGLVVRAMPPGQANTAAYLKLHNGSLKAVALVGGSVTFAQRLEIHQTRQVDGYMRMEKLDQVIIAPGQTLSLEPGGAHLMLFGLEQALTPGAEVTLCLDFMAAPTVCGRGEVRKPGMESSGHDHHH